MADTRLPVMSRLERVRGKPRQITLYVTEEMYREIEERAERTHRSRGKMCLYLLEIGLEAVRKSDVD